MKISKVYLFLVILLSVLFLSSCKENKNVEVTTSDDGIQQIAVQEDRFSNSKLKAKVNHVLGNVDLLRNSRTKKLNVGNKVIENDRVRTALESEASLSLADGSVFTIAELSEVLFSVGLDDNNKQRLLMNIEKGRLHFDVQKQNEREVHFVTGTAVAAIRGTSGFVGVANGKAMASLKEGKIELTDAHGKKKFVNKNQTAIVDNQGNATVLNLQSSGTQALSNELDSLAATETASLEKSLQKFDTDYSKSKDNFESKLQFRATPVGDSLFVPTVTLTARVTPGIFVKVWGVTDTIPANGVYQRTFAWDESAYGTKRFLATCGDGFVEVPCFMWVTEYAAVLIDSTKQSVEVNENVEQEIPKKVQNEKAESIGAKKIKLSVKIAGKREDRVHLDLPATEYKTNLKFNLSGITADDLEQLKSLEILRNGKRFKSFDENDLTALAYEVPVSVPRNKIADFEVVATLKNGKKFRALKTYEVYCLLSNHPGGKARNSILPPEQEYERIKQNGGIAHE